MMITHIYMSKNTHHHTHHTVPRPSTALHMSCYLIEGEGPDRVGGQLHCVQQSDLDQAVGLCAPRRPVLITLHLQEEEEKL